MTKSEDIVILITRDDESRPSTISDVSRATSVNEPKRRQMAPMFVFLASSFNVELVYSILKGITQFGYITLCEPDSVRDKLAKMRMKVGEENTELTFFEIKIKNYSNWDATSHKDFMQENWVKLRQTH